MKLHHIVWAARLALCVSLPVVRSQAQRPEIIEYSRDGTLTFNSVRVGDAYTLEFASSLEGPWASWGAVTDQPITGQVMSLPTPVYFRIKETAPGVIDDPAFSGFLCARGFDQNRDYRISADEAEMVTWLEVSSSGFRELDCTPFTNLEQLLQVRNVLLTNINIKANTKLTRLDCSYSRLTSVDTRRNTNLVALNVTDNMLTNIDLSSNFALERLYLNNNMITRLDMSVNVNLAYVDLRGNPTEEIVVWWPLAIPAPITMYYDGSPTLINP